MEDLGAKTPWGTIEPFVCNEIPNCLHCGVLITKENDSGWQGVTEDPRIFQVECKKCHPIEKQFKKL